MGRGKNKANKEKQKRSRIFYQSNNVNQSKFSETLKQQGLRLKIQCGDGNCLFRSIGDQVYGDTNKHSELRSLVVSYLTENMEYFKMFMEDGNHITHSYSYIFLFLLLLLLFLLLLLLLLLYN